jgi:hypothetical protein
MPYIDPNQAGCLTGERAKPTEIARLAQQHLPVDS